MAASSDPITSVPVHASTLRLLQEFKTGAQNWDAFLLELLDRQLDREDLEYARRVLSELRAGKVRATPWHPGRARPVVPRKR